MNQTKPTKVSDIKRVWHLVDVKDKILGRIATEIAGKLIGKSKPIFVRNLDVGDYVVVINAIHVKVTGHKVKEKVYTRYSGYPGGMKKKTFEQLMEENPQEIIRRAVFGMLPKNKLRADMISRLYIAAEADHDYSDKFSL